MNDVQTLLLGVALGAVPSARFGRIAAALIAKKAGLKPQEIARYDEATDGDSEEA